MELFLRTTDEAIDQYSMLMVVPLFRAARTGRRILPSTARLAVVAAAILERSDLDELVLEAQSNFRRERQIRLSPDLPTL